MVQGVLDRDFVRILATSSRDQGHNEGTCIDTVCKSRKKPHVYFHCVGTESNNQTNTEHSTFIL